MLALPLLVALAALAAVRWLLPALRCVARRRRAHEPPLVRGNVLLGVGAQFQQNAVRFLHATTARVGPVFTMRLLNKWVTIVNDPHLFFAFCKQHEFDFEPVQKQVNQNVFKFAIKNSPLIIRNASKSTRGALLTRNMQHFNRFLHDALDTSVLAPLETAGAQVGTSGLMELLAHTQFVAIFDAIFGRAEQNSNGSHGSAAFTALRVKKQMDALHRYFNFLWLGLPHCLFPAVTRALTYLCDQPSAEEIIARPDSSAYMKFALDALRRDGQTDADIKGHNLVYLHVNYITFRLTFWLLYQLLTHPDALAAVVDEIDAYVEQRTDENKVARVSFDEFASSRALPLLESALLETMRVSSGVFMIRQVTADAEFEGYRLRHGDMVAMYPPALHHDPEVFAEPHAFVHDRFVNGATFSKAGRELPMRPVLAFGTLCPGQQLATQQIRWTALLLLSRFTFALASTSERTDYDRNCYGHEVLPPLHDVRVTFAPRKSVQITIVD